jgi:hypothetical protein
MTTYGRGDTSLVEKELRSRTLYSRLIGALFLAGFLFYGVGFSLVDSIISEPDFVSTIPEQETLLVFGAFLMLVNIGVDVGKGVLFFPILEGRQANRARLPGRADCPGGFPGHRGALSSDARSPGRAGC